MKLICKLLAIILLLGGTIEAQANGSASNVTITNLQSYNYGAILNVWISANSSGYPACATAINVFVIDGTTSSGKVLIAIVQSAWALGKSVDLGGNGSCSVVPNAETLYSVYTH